MGSYLGLEYTLGMHALTIQRLKPISLDMNSRSTNRGLRSGISNGYSVGLMRCDCQMGPKVCHGKDGKVDEQWEYVIIPFSAMHIVNAQ